MEEILLPSTPRRRYFISIKNCYCFMLFDVSTTHCTHEFGTYLILLHTLSIALQLQRVWCTACVYAVHVCWCYLWTNTYCATYTCHVNVFERAQLLPLTVICFSIFFQLVFVATQKRDHFLVRVKYLMFHSPYRNF